MNIKTLYDNKMVICLQALHFVSFSWSTKAWLKVTLALIDTGGQYRALCNGYHLVNPEKGPHFELVSGTCHHTVNTFTDQSFVSHHKSFVFIQQ